MPVNFRILSKCAHCKSEDNYYSMKKISTVIFALFLVNSHVNAQTVMSNYGSEELPIIELPFQNPYEELLANDILLRTNGSGGELSGDLLARVLDIYRLHFRALEAQLQNDLIAAETNINDALTQIHALMEENPDVQGTRKFTEMYRSVMSAYQDFYGIEGPVSMAYGDIFAVHQEMFMNDDWFDDASFSFPEDITIQKTDVPLIRNRQVNNHIAYLTVRRPDIMERWLQRSAYWFPMMREIFEEEGVPLELIHLSMIESGLVPVARSHAAAVGMWQFIYATGAVYGLERNWWIDERRDPIKSTRAAAQHLRDLYEFWGDWHLALANYNVSTRRMRSSIRLAGGERNYWAIFPYLPRETRGYVPGYIAATLIAMNPEEFGFEIDNSDVVPYTFETVPVQGSIDLRVLAEAAGIATDVLRNYNPELLRWATPPGPEPYHLKLPVGTKEVFLANYEQIPDDQRINNMVIHSVNRGETLGAIANRYGTTVRDLYAVNDGLSHIIHPGQQIVIPVPGNNVAIRSDRPSNSQVARTAATQQRQAANQPANTVAVTYTVKSGDTIGHIAEWFDTQAWRIRSWNNVGNMIRVGQRLTIYVPRQHQAYYAAINNMTLAQKRQLEGRRGPVALTDSDGVRRYTVQRNDNLSDLARTFGTTVQEIMRVNGLNSHTIYIGQSLIIPN